MGGSLFLPGTNGQYTRKGANYIHIDLDGKRATISMDGEPETLCQMVYDLMSANEPLAKVILTVVFQFMQTKGISHSQLKKHTFFQQ